MSYIQYFDISGNTVSMIDSGNTLQIVNLEATHLLVSGDTFDTTTLVTSGTTQTISGYKNFTSGVTVTGLTAANSINVIGSNINRPGQSLFYDNNITGFTNKYHGYTVKYISAAMSPYYSSDVSIHYICDTSGGDIIINLPNYSVDNINSNIVIAKITSDSYHIQINTPTGYTFLDGGENEYINKFNEHIQITCVGPYLNVLYKITSDNRSNRSVIRVSPYNNTPTDFHNLKDAVDFLNARNDSDAVIQLDSGVYYIDDTITVNNDYYLTFEGAAYDSTSIVSSTGLTGKKMFDCLSNVNFEKLSIYGYAYGLGYSGYGYSVGEDGVHINASDLYIQFQDIGIYGFYNNIHMSGNSEIWVFNSSLEDAASSAIFDWMGNVTVSETGFANNKRSVWLNSGYSNKVSIENSIFELTNSAQTAIYYESAKFGYDIFYMQGNALYGSGTALSGFNFSLVKDANIIITANPGIQNYDPLTLLVFNNNTTTTSIGTTAVKVNGTNYTGGTGGYIGTSSIKFSTSVNNRAIYLPATSFPLRLVVTGNVSNATNTRNLIVSIVKNSNRTGATLVDIEVRCQTQNVQYPFAFQTFDIAPAQNDYYEIWCLDSAGGSVATMRDLHFQISKL